MKAGYSVRFEPITVGARLGVSKIKLVSDGARFLMILLKVITIFSPLRVFLPIAAAFFALGAGLRHLDRRSRGTTSPTRRCSSSSWPSSSFSSDSFPSRSRPCARKDLDECDSRHRHLQRAGQSSRARSRPFLQHPGYRIIVVDDDSPDGTGRWRTSSRHSQRQPGIGHPPHGRARRWGDRSWQGSSARSKAMPT